MDLLALDEQLFLWVYRLPLPVMAVVAVTHLAAYGGVFLLAALAMLASGRRNAMRVGAAVVVALGAQALIVSAGLKTWVARPRPFGPLGVELRDSLVNAESLSFPSGHTAASVAVAVVLGAWSPRLRPVLFGVAALIGFSRVFVGAHYPADVLAGGAIGAVIGLGVARLFAIPRLASTGEADPLRALAAQRQSMPLLVGLLLLGAGRTALAEPFVFVSLPDTQIYADNRFPGHPETPAITDSRGTGALFHDQTRWIVDNAREMGIRYVGHLGDIVQDGDDPVQWSLARTALGRLLAADIPHGTVMGNHDRSHGEAYRANYLDSFGPAVFAGRSWYTASSPGGGASFQRLEHGAYQIGFLNFSLDHPQAELDWAAEILEAHPDTIFVIGTHRYLADFKLAAGRHGERVPTLIGNVKIPSQVQSRVVEAHDGEAFFQEFVSQHPNVLMIHAGHVHSDWHRLETGQGAAQTIVEVLSNYQDARNGGDGWLRIYEFDFEADELRFRTYSPTLGRHRTTLDHYVESIFLLYDQRAKLMDAIGIDDEALYFQLLPLVLGDGPTPDGFLLQHPDLDEPEELAYYQAYLLDLFSGAPPEGFSDILAWEQLWTRAFAANPADPFDFSDGVRSPRATLPIDFARYFVASPEQQRRLAFAELIAAIEALDDAVVSSERARKALLRYAQAGARAVERGQLQHADRWLERIGVRNDGCVERGAPDPRLPKRRGFASSKGWDFVTTCEGQVELQARVAEAAATLP